MAAVVTARARKEFDQAKKTDSRFAGWWQENSKEAYNTGLAGAAAAFDNYAKSKRGQRKGQRMGVPRPAFFAPCCASAADRLSSLWFYSFAAGAAHGTRRRLPAPRSWPPRHAVAVRRVGRRSPWFLPVSVVAGHHCLTPADLCKRRGELASPG